MAVSLPMPLLGQTAKKIADINKKVIGKWWTSDGENYIEFLANGVCSEGALYPDGKWHVDEGKLEAWEKGEEFSCLNGALTLIGPNKLTRDYGMGGEVTKYYRGSQPPPKTEHTLTLAVAQRILSQKINIQTANNTLLTCHACYDPSDREDNDKAPLVSTYSAPLSQFLMKHGYIRMNGEQQVFTAKAKRSKYYVVDKGFAGFRFVSFKNPKILINKIVDPNYVPIEYDFVPTELTTGIFGKVQRVKSFASFSYRNEAWTMCIDCRH
jgi:hypothetical protein